MSWRLYVRRWLLRPSDHLERWGSLMMSSVIDYDDLKVLMLWNTCRWLPYPSSCVGDGCYCLSASFNSSLKAMENLRAKVVIDEEALLESPGPT